MHRFLLIGLLSMVVALGACSNEAPTPPPSSTSASAARSGPLAVIAMNTPLACFVKRIGGDLVAVTMPVPAGEDPAFWSPSGDAVVAMQKADLVVLNGAGHEPWRATVALPERSVVETSDRFKGQWIEVAEGVTHSHGLAGMHSHKGTSFTTWIDPALAIEQAEAVLDALKNAMPSAAQQFESNFASLKTDLEAIDRSLEAAIHGQQSLPILFSHPIYDYLTRRFALNAVSVHWEPGDMPPDDEWKKLEAALKEHPARWMIWEDEPAQVTRTKLRELGVESVVFRPAGNMPGDPLRWLDVQRDNAKELAKVFE